MKDQSKTKQVLIQELASLRQRIPELERSESGRAEEMAPGKSLPDTGKHGIAVHCSFACLRDIAHE
jgi:hypothetical protein